MKSESRNPVRKFVGWVTSGQRSCSSELGFPKLIFKYFQLGLLMCFIRPQWFQQGQNWGRWLWPRQPLPAWIEVIMETAKKLAWWNATKGFGFDRCGMDNCQSALGLTTTADCCRIGEFLHSLLLICKEWSHIQNIFQNISLAAQSPITVGSLLLPHQSHCQHKYKGLQKETWLPVWQSKTSK